MTPITLFELNNHLRTIVEDSFDDDVWVIGELLEGRPAAGGHFYGEIVQKDEHNGALIARARIVIWARTYNMLRFRFQQETGQTLRAGLQLLLRVSVSFHEQYGYSLNVNDIDASYTIGDLARRRQEIIRQLIADGIIDDNKTLPLPILMQRIAVISSENAAGYGDFYDQLINNDYGLRFDIKLFPALMQGNRVETSITQALEQIAEEEEQWDCVVIIRGGGSTSDLSDFDSYLLSAAIAQFPLPVIIGIGHERDETVLDHVAHLSLKTPTAVAAYIIDYQLEALTQLNDIGQRINSAAQSRLNHEHVRMERLTTFFPLAYARLRERHSNHVDMLWQRLHSAFPSRLTQSRHQLDMLEQRIKGADPALLLKRGYSITTCGGKVVRSIDDLKTGEVLMTRLEQGEILSTIICKQKT